MLALINEFLGMPPLASENGEMVDQMLELVHWFMILLGIGWSIYLILVFTKFRKPVNPTADYRGVRGHASTHIEVGVVIVEAILLLGFAFPLWAKQSEKYPTGRDVLKMRAVGEAFQWNFQYPGLDGTLGRQNLKLVDAASNNVIGRDLKDPNGKDDFVKNSVMTLPKGRPVIVDVTSKDVIHSLALTPMRMTQDATPGVNGHMWFRPTKTGEWDIICAQLCGPGHSQMKARVVVMEPKEFDAFMKEESERALKATSTPAPAAAAPAPAHK